LLKGISNEVIQVPLNELHLETEFVDENVLCGVIQNLPDGVDFLLGNDIWAQSHPEESEKTYDAVVVTRSKSAVLAKSFVSKAITSSKPVAELSPISNSLSQPIRDDSLSIMVHPVILLRIRLANKLS